MLAISRRWKTPEKTYRAAYVSALPALVLGDVQFVQVDDSTTVANMIGQHGIRRQNPKAAPPSRYPVITQGLQNMLWSIRLPFIYRALVVVWLGGGGDIIPY